MTRALVLLASAVAIGCAVEVAEPITPTTTDPLPAFVLSGIVHDSAGIPIPGATAEVPEGPYAGLTNLSDHTGSFRIALVRGRLTLRVWKEGYSSYARNLTVSADQAFDVELLDLRVEFDIALGRTIRSYVRGGSPPCDPVRWDARAPCRRFRFTAPASGQLTVAISWEGDPALDAVIMSPADTYLAFSEQSGSRQATVRGWVQAGMTYEVRVYSYFDETLFNLKADLN